jgi:hypothetical protein
VRKGEELIQMSKIAPQYGGVSKEVKEDANAQLYLASSY